ncbi:MAG TPA: nitroreductase family protein [Thermomicrobiaceae bacterium]|nr:nitroreductase family protein [Thermomicrobiaceae bacterium]
MDAYLNIISLRAVRDYTGQPLAEQELERILQAGRVAGSAGNRQPWTFVAITDRATLDKLAEVVYEPDNLRGAAVAVAVVVRTVNQGFDAGRASENMMLAAWAGGIGSSPNGLREREPAHTILSVPTDHYIANLITFGYPKKPRRVSDTTPEGLLARVKRKPLSELVRRI